MNDPLKWSLAYERDSEIIWHLLGPGDADQVAAINITKKGILYVSMDIGGVYKSEDWGESWMPINTGIKNYDVVTPVVVDSQNPSTLYIGTRGGIYKSINGGRTWDAKWRGIGSGSPASFSLSACIGSIALDPFNPRIVYAGIGYRPSSEGSTVVRRIKWKGIIYRSSDRGETWGVIASLGDDVMIRHIYLLTSEIMYAATNAGIFKSVNSGKTWDNIFPVFANYIISNPDNSDILYTAVGEDGIYKSLDAGNSWVKANKGLSLQSGSPIHRDNYTQLVIDSHKPDTVYTVSTTWGSGGGVYESTNGGDSWQIMTKWEQGKGNVESAWLKLSRRVNAISMDPQNSNRLFIGTSRYIYKTEDSGNSWQQIISRQASDDTWEHRGINVFGHTRVVGIDPIDTNRIYIGTVDHGLVKSNDGGKSWKQAVKGMLYKDNIYDITFDKNNSIAYVINGKGGFKEAGVAMTHDFGENWEQLNGLAKKMYYSILISPDNPNTIYVGGKSGVVMTRNGGKNWVMKNRGIENEIVHKLLFSSDSKETIFAATERGLFKTNDCGVSWHKTHLFDMNIYSLVIDPLDASTIYAGTVQKGHKLPGGVFKSKDAGKSWQRILQAERIESMAIVPQKPLIIYALSNDFAYHDDSGGQGVFRSTNGGDTWKSINKGLSVLRGFNLNIAPYPPYRIYLSSNGSGAYATTDPDVAVALQ